MKQIASFILVFISVFISVNAQVNTGHLENIVPGEDITAPAWIYFSTVDGKAYKADASNIAHRAVALVTQNCTLSSGYGQAYFSGVVEWPSSLTVGAAYYLSTTAGAMTTTAPTNAQVVGRAVSNTRLIITPATFNTETSLTGILVAASGQLSVATAGDFPTLNQNTTGTASNVTGTVAIANGGTGSTTKNFTDITTTQTVAGAKTWSNAATFSAGLASTGGDVSINASSNFNTNLNTGTSTGQTNIGNASGAGTLITGKVVTQGAFNYAADNAVNDSYTITLSPAPTAYVTGMYVCFKATNANTTGCSLNVNGLGAKTMVKRVSTTMATGDILAGMLCMCVYDGTNFVLMNPVVN